MKLLVCTQQRYAPNPQSCGHRGSCNIADVLEQCITSKGLQAVVERTGCMGMCQHGPNIRLLPDGKTWQQVGEQDISEILSFMSNTGNKTTTS